MVTTRSNQMIEENNHSFFTKMCDELVKIAEHDPELMDSVRFIDSKAQKKGVSFYDMVFETLYKHDINSKASKWLHSRN